jgi:hypothetical protein
LPEPLFDELLPRSLEPLERDEPDVDRELVDRSLPPTFLPGELFPPPPEYWFFPLGLLLVGMSCFSSVGAAKRRQRIEECMWRTRKKTLVFKAAFAFRT